MSTASKCWDMSDCFQWLHSDKRWVRLLRKQLKEDRCDIKTSPGGLTSQKVGALKNRYHRNWMLQTAGVIENTSPEGWSSRTEWMSKNVSVTENGCHRGLVPQNTDVRGRTDVTKHRCHSKISVSHYSLLLIWFIYCLHKIFKSVSACVCVAILQCWTHTAEQLNYRLADTSYRFHDNTTFTLQGSCLTKDVCRCESWTRRNWHFNECLAHH